MFSFSKNPERNLTQDPFIFNVLNDGQKNHKNDSKKSKYNAKIFFFSDLANQKLFFKLRSCKWGIVYIDLKDNILIIVNVE